METTKNTKNTKEGHDFDSLSRNVIGCAIEVHKTLGPGLLESAYQQCLAHELHLSGIAFEVEAPIPVQYKQTMLNCGFRADLIIENQLIVELKSVEQLTDIHKAQLLTYLKLKKCRTGLLINFNTQKLKHGIKRFVL